MEEWNFNIGWGGYINNRVKTEKGQNPSSYTNARRYIKIRCNGTKFIGSRLQHPTGVPYTNGSVTSVMLMRFQTMGTDMVTWTLIIRWMRNRGIRRWG